MQKAASACYIPVTAIFFNWNSTCVRLLKIIAAANKPKFLSMLLELFDVSHLANHIDFSIEISYVPWIWVVIWQSIYFPVAPHWNQNLPKYQMPWSIRSKVYHAVNFFERAHQCQMVSCQWVVLFVPPWHPKVKQPIVPPGRLASFRSVKPQIVPAVLHVLCAVDSLSCSRDTLAKAAEPQRLASLNLTLDSCKFTRCWNVSLLRLRTSALRCQQCQDCARLPASIIPSPDRPWQQLYLLYHHTSDHAPAEASLRLGIVACCRFIVWIRHWQALGAICLLPPSARTAVKDACFQCLVNENYLNLSAGKGRVGGWVGGWEVELDSDVISTVIWPGYRVYNLLDIL